MKKFLYLFLAVFLVSCGSDNTANISSGTSDGGASVRISAASILNQMDRATYKDGEVLVKFKSGTVSTSSVKAHQAVGAKVVKKFKLVRNLEKVELPEGVSVKEAVQAYLADPNVEYAEPNYIRKTMAAFPIDNYFGDQWGMHNTGQFAGGTPDADIDAPEAWDITSGSSSVVVAILDGGMDYGHPDLVGNIWKNPLETCNNGIDDDSNGYVDDCTGWNFFHDNKEPLDESGHGTHVAGIVGAVGNNVIGTVGVMWHVNLMPLKFIGYYDDPEVCGGTTNFCGDTDDEIEGIEYAVANGADIINMSFGGYEYSQAEIDTIYNAALNHKVIFVAAAGNETNNNDGVSKLYPASYGHPSIISVAATDQNDLLAPFSNFGVSTVHVGAPGVYILSTFPVYLVSPDGFVGYSFNWGTSMAAPHVSGLAGLLWSYYTHFDHYQVIYTIRRYVDQTAISGWTVTYGRINAYRALSSLLTPADFTATPVSPTEVALAWTDAATGEEAYTVERSTSGGAYQVLSSTLPADTSSYNDSGLGDGTAYTYKVKATNTIPAESFYSPEVTAITPLGTPTGLVAQGTSASQIQLTWTDNAQNETGYVIERRDDPEDAFAQVGTAGANAASFTDSGLQNKTSYQYRVKATNAIAESAYSNEAVGTTRSGRRGGGGSSCSISGAVNGPSAFADCAVLLIPFFIMLIMKLRCSKRA
jgi:subtilisin family serine protease